MNSAHGYTEGAEVPEDKTTDNELIAEFDGWIFCNDDSKSYPDGYWVLETEDGRFWETYNSLKYHESWDWLMPVVQKIFDTEFGDKFEEWRILNGRIISAIGRIDIIDAHKKVAEFVRWYNSK